MGIMEGKEGVCRGRGDRSHLLQISWEAKRINQMIDAWSKSPRFDGRSRDFSADPLEKGALDLQESMVVLEKLQRSSELLTQSRSKFQGCGIRVMKLSGAGTGSGSSHGVAELKKVIRDSLYRKNLLNNGGKARASPPPEKERPRAPNLIARLMGLDESPPERFPAPGKKASPSAPAPAPALEKADRSRKCLQDIIESMKLKGLLGETLSRVPAHPVLRRQQIHAEEEDPPIVIIKPMNLAGSPAATERSKTSGEIAGEGTQLNWREDVPEKINKVDFPPAKRQTKDEVKARRKLIDDQKPASERTVNRRNTGSQTKAGPPPAREAERKPPAPAKNSVIAPKSSSSTRRSADSAREKRTKSARGPAAPPVEDGAKPMEEEKMEMVPRHSRAFRSPIAPREEKSAEVIFHLDHHEYPQLEDKRSGPGEKTAAEAALRGDGGAEEVVERIRRRMEEDLRHNDGGAWHSSWANFSPPEEARDLVRHLENYLLNLLIVELFTG